MSNKLVRLTEGDLHRIIKESINNVLNENESGFLPHLERTYRNLHSEYEKWQYASYKPQGMDEVINSIINAMHNVEDVIDNIKSHNI